MINSLIKDELPSHHAKLWELMQQNLGYGRERVGELDHHIGNPAGRWYFLRIAESYQKYHLCNDRRGAGFYSVSASIGSLPVYGFCARWFTVIDHLFWGSRALRVEVNRLVGTGKRS